MKNKKHILSLLMALAATQAYGQYDIKNHSINNGGEKITGGVYEMNSSIGQVDASNTQTGGIYSLNGGVWHKVNTTPQPELIFTNGFE